MLDTMKEDVIIIIDVKSPIPLVLDIVIFLN